MEPTRMKGKPGRPGHGPEGERMDDHEEMARVLARIDGRGYKAYKDLRGTWAFPDFRLRVDHVQGDPFAEPSRVRVLLSPSVSGLPREACRPGPRAVGTACLLARRFRDEARSHERRRGSGKSGVLRIEAPGQEVIPSTAVLVSEEGAVEARFQVGLPARGRRVLGRHATELLLEDVPAVVDASLRARAYDPDEVMEHAEANEDADALREALGPRALVAFVADGARLPRRSGVEELPLEGDAVVPFRSPESLRMAVPLPNRGEVTGMGVPRGVTLIVGGGYHGKSTLLRALERGVYNHRPGDGRELVVTDAAAVKVRAEDGRSVATVDISPFIGDLPAAIDTRRFSSENASGSTSQAAAIMEALEAGATALLVDEDTAATNFMIRDRRMQALVPRDREPITPYIDRVRELHEDRGVSSILVLGGSGDYLDVADTVVAMTGYVPSDLTDRAREVAAAHPTGRIPEASGAISEPPPRIPLPASVDPSRGRRKVSIRVRDTGRVQFGRGEIDLSGVDQLVSPAQTRAMSEALLLARERFMDGKRSVPRILDLVMETLERDGLDALGYGDSGNLALFRRYELAAALNRLRGLRVAGPGEPSPNQETGP
jgi:predicted ABC-class ATPase